MRKTTSSRNWTERVSFWREKMGRTMVRVVVEPRCPGLYLGEVEAVVGGLPMDGWRWRNGVVDGG